MVRPCCPPWILPIPKRQGQSSTHSIDGVFSVLPSNRPLFTCRLVVRRNNRGIGHAAYRTAIGPAPADLKPTSHVLPRCPTLFAKKKLWHLTFSSLTGKAKTDEVASQIVNPGVDQESSPNVVPKHPPWCHSK